MDIISLFREFGYPALISGMLIWFIVTKLEAIRLTDEKRIAANEELSTLIKTKIQAMEERIKERKELDEDLKIYLIRLDYFLESLSKEKPDVNRPTRPRGK